MFHQHFVPQFGLERHPWEEVNQVAVAGHVLACTSTILTTRLSALEHDSPVGYADGHEDPDGDGVLSRHEVSLGTNPCAADTDGDGIPDGEELLAGSDPRNRESVPLPVRVAVPDSSLNLGTCGRGTRQQRRAGGPRLDPRDGQRVVVGRSRQEGPEQHTGHCEVWRIARGRVQGSNHYRCPGKSAGGAHCAPGGSLRFPEPENRTGSRRGYRPGDADVQLLG